MACYFQIVKPFAESLMGDWEWIGDLGLILSSPALTFAVAAFGSLFSNLYRDGPSAVVVPPHARAGERPLWTIPAWFDLQTKALAELQPQLTDPSKVDDMTFQAVLFLARIAILLADGASIRLHHQGLNRLSTILRRNGPCLERELAVARVSMVDAFLHQDTL
jgi:hypothetical protein